MNEKEKFYAKNNMNWGHRWGYKDSEFVLNQDRSVSMTGKRYEICGIKMPDFIPYVEEMLGVSIDPDDKLEENDDKIVKDPKINEPFYNSIQSNFSKDRFTFDNGERLLHSQGQTTDEVHKAMYSSIDKINCVPDPNPICFCGLSTQSTRIFLLSLLSHRK